MTSWITICDTCKRENWDPVLQQKTDGEILADMIEPLAKTLGLKTRRVSCMMGCVRACNVAIQGPKKLAYLLGTFEPTEENAQAIVDYAALHRASDRGQVPYRQWPLHIKGHFSSRLAPLPEVE